MSWQDRLGQDIRLTSPNGDEFTALFVGNDRTLDKKLGIFEYPDFDGTVTQDLGVGGARYPLDIYFEGENCDTEGQRFFSACEQRGRWTVIHPIYGSLSLQLVSVADRTNLVTDGNIARFETRWIEPSEQSSTVSTQELGSAVDAQFVQVNATSTAQFNENLALVTAGETIAAKATTEQSVMLADNRLRDLYENNDSIAAEIAAIKRGITDTLDQTVLDPLVLASQIQQLVQLPALAIQDISSRLSVYEDIVNDLIGVDTGGDDSEGKNSVSVIELFLSAIAAVNAQIVTTGELRTQPQAVELATRINDTFQTVTNVLDIRQEDFNAADIDMQYFSQSSSYVDAYRITAQGIAFLLTSALDLATEKRFTLDKPRAPIEITVTEYGDRGDNDNNLDFFIETNDLHGSELLLLPAGTSVVVYV